jgi:hypothetical protein
MARAARVIPEQKPRGPAKPKFTSTEEKMHLAATEDVREFAEQLPEKFLLCRELGHNWRPFTASRYRDGGFLRILKCPRCRSERHQELSSRGGVVANKYVHAEGYLHKGQGRITGDGRDVLRLVSLTHTLGKTHPEVAS